MNDHENFLLDRAEARDAHDDAHEQDRIDRRRGLTLDAAADAIKARVRTLHHMMDSAATDLLRMSEEAMAIEAKLGEAIKDAGSDLLIDHPEVSKLEDEVDDLRTRLDSAYKAVLR